MPDEASVNRNEWTVRRRSRWTVASAKSITNNNSTIRVSYLQLLDLGRDVPHEVLTQVLQTVGSDQLSQGTQLWYHM